jgi:hypothetical protein
MDWLGLVVVGGGEEREDALVGFVEKELCRYFPIDTALLAI